MEDNPRSRAAWTKARNRAAWTKVWKAWRGEKTWREDVEDVERRDVEGVERRDVEGVEGMSWTRRKALAEAWKTQRRAWNAALMKAWTKARRRRGGRAGNVHRACGGECVCVCVWRRVGWSRQALPQGAWET